MDEQLAAIYGTGMVDEPDIEKTAAAELLVKLAEEEGVDLDDFSDDEVQEMIQGLYEDGAEGGEVDDGVEHTAEAQEKFAEADFLGRVMAHSMVQELDNIEKEAGLSQSVKRGLRRAGEATGVSAMLAGHRSAGRAGRQISKAKEMARAAKSRGSEKVGPAASEKVKALMRRQEKAKALRAAGAKRFGKRVGGGAAAAGGVAGLGYAAGKGKEASAFEALAQERAYEMAKQAGYIDDDGTFRIDLDVSTEREKMAFDAELERRALEICEAEGLPVEWSE